MAGGKAEARVAEKAVEGVVAKVVKGSVRDAEKVGVKDGGRDLARDVGKTFDNAHPGPLSPGKASTFADGRYEVGVTKDARTFYRAGDSGAAHDPHLGQYFTDKPPSSVEQVRRESAVKEVWTDEHGKVTGRSPLNTGYGVEFPPGTVYYYGKVADQGGKYVGGGMQYYIETPWLMDPKPPKVSEWPLKP